MNARFAKCASPDYWLFDHERADFESQKIMERLNTQQPATVTFKAGERTFLIQRRQLDTGHIYFMAPLEAR